MGRSSTKLQYKLQYKFPSLALRSRVRRNQNDMLVPWLVRPTSPEGKLGLARTVSRAYCIRYRAAPACSHDQTQRTPSHSGRPCCSFFSTSGCIHLVDGIGMIHANSFPLLLYFATLLGYHRHTCTAPFKRPFLPIASSHVGQSYPDAHLLLRPIVAHKIRTRRRSLFCGRFFIWHQ